MGALCLHHQPILRAMGALGTCLRSRIRVLDGQTNVIQVSTRMSNGLMDVGYQWHRDEACGCTHWRTLAPTSSRIRRIQPPVEARVWAKTGAGGRSTGGWRRHRRISPLVYASQWAPSSSMGWKPLSRGNKSVGSASWQAQARPHRHGGHMGSCHCTIILAPTKASPTPGPVVVF